MGDEFDIYDLIGDGNMFEIPEQDVLDLIGDPGAFGLGGGEEGVDPWDLMGDPSAFGLGGDSGLSLGSIGGWLSQIGRLFGGGSGSGSGANGGGMGMSPLMTLLGLGALAGAASISTGARARRPTQCSRRTGMRRLSCASRWARTSRGSRRGRALGPALSGSCRRCLRRTLRRHTVGLRTGIDRSAAGAAWCRNSRAVLAVLRAEDDDGCDYWTVGRDGPGRRYEAEYSTDGRAATRQSCKCALHV